MGGDASKFGGKTAALEIVNTYVPNKGLTGKTAIVTGGNSGIGLETCKALAHAGCRVLLCSRSVAAGTKAITDEIAVNGNGNYAVSDTSNIVVKQLDLSELSSVKNFADDVITSNERIDFLVLNAGIMALPNLEFTSAGFERQIGVNHFGHAYLVMLLESHLLAQSFPSRVVVLSSMAHQQGTIDLNDMHYKKGRVYQDWSAYGQSKLANLIYAKGLALKFASNGLIKTCSVHPGVIQTNLWQNNDGWKSTLIKKIFTDKDIPQGASTTLFGCLHPELRSGAYLKDCAESEPLTKAARDPHNTLSKAFLESTEAQLLAAAGNVL